MKSDWGSFSWWGMGFGFVPMLLSCGLANKHIRTSIQRH